jgi:hypothetical protein
MDKFAAEQDQEPLNLFKRPFSLALFMVLILFVAFFVKAPPEVLRLVRLLLIFPTIRITLAVFEKELRRPVLALGAFYVLDTTSGNVAAGDLTGDFCTR